MKEGIVGLEKRYVIWLFNFFIDLLEFCMYLKLKYFFGEKEMSIRFSEIFH